MIPIVDASDSLLVGGVGVVLKWGVPNGLTWK